MRYYLINVKTGLVIGAYTKRGSGWGFLPFTSAHGGSRKAHMTRAAASNRYTTPNCVEIEAVNTPDAARLAKERQVAYNAWKPCSECALAANRSKPETPDYHCCAGAAPGLARILGKCAKFLSEAEAQAQHEAAIVSLPVTDEEITGEYEI